MSGAKGNMNFGNGAFGNRFGGWGGQFENRFNGFGGNGFGGWGGFGGHFQQRLADRFGGGFPQRTTATPQPTGTDWNSVYQQMIGVGIPQSPAVSLNPSSQISPSGVPYTQGLLGSYAPPLGMGWANQIQQMQGGGVPPGYTGPIY